MTQLAEENEDSERAQAKGFLEDAESEEDEGLGIKFPIFDDPASIFKMLFGQAVDLVTWDIPRLEAKFEFSQLFGPLLPPVPLFAEIAGSFEAFADFYVGLDTPRHHGQEILNGFYIGDRDPTTPEGEDT